MANHVSLRRLSCGLLCLCIPGLALAGSPAGPGDDAHYAAQRQLLEALVGCLQGNATSNQRPGRAPDPARCASERAAYANTLPRSRMAEILADLDAGPGQSAP